jgi:ADP-ribose pyrophosphatase
MEKKIYEGFANLSEVDVVVNGEKKVYVKVDIKDAVCALVINEKKEIGLVKQYRPILQKETLEIPAGVIDKKKPEVEIMLEELWEECSIKEDNITYFNFIPIFDYYMVSGISTATTKIYEIHVQGVKSKKIINDDVLSFAFYNPKEIEIMIEERIIEDAKTIIAYQYYNQKILGNKE